MSSRLARAIPALVLVAAIGTGCSSKSSNTTAPAPVPGPNFSYAFPATGTSNKRVFTATEVGSWDYHCIPHQSAGMVGTVVVVAGTPVDSAVVQVGFNGTGQDFKFFPSTVTIHAGGYVRWVNASSLTTHTVTRGQ